MFVTDAGNREVLEYDGASGAILRWYSYGLGSNDVLNQMNVAAATRAALVPDILGSVIGSQDSVSGTLSKIGYLPYGKSANAPGAFGFTAQRIDAETGGLYYYRARHYSPAWGRFLQTDPIGYGGGGNLYAYVNNDPLNNTDPLGLWGIFASYGGTVVAGTGPYVAATVTNLNTGAQYQINGAVATAQVGAGAFVGGGLGPSVGGFFTSQAELTGLTPSGTSVCLAYNIQAANRVTEPRFTPYLLVERWALDSAAMTRTRPPQNKSRQKHEFSY